MKRTSSPILWYGDFVDFGSFEGAVTGNDVDRSISFLFGIDRLMVSLRGPFGVVTRRITRRLTNIRLETRISALVEPNTPSTDNVKTYISLLTISFGDGAYAIEMDEKGELAKLTVDGHDVRPLFDDYQIYFSSDAVFPELEIYPREREARAAPYTVDGAYLVQAVMRVIGNAIEIALDAACRPELYSRSLLLVEDEVTDGKLYEFLLNSTRDTLRLPVLQWEVAHGGGERIIEVAAEKIADGRITCAIYDKDSQSPFSYDGKKARELRALAANAPWKLFFPVSTPGREVENLIPLQVIALLQCAVGSSALQSMLLDIETREGNAGHGRADLYYMHFDIKLGCSHEHLAKACCSDELAWMQRKLSLVIQDLSAFSINGFGEKVIPLLLETGEALSELRRIVRSHRWLELFKDFILQFAWIFAGGIHQRT